MTASGEIKPKVYVNIGANAFAKITHLYVKEGDRVKKGQMLAMLDNIQPAADVSAMIPPSTPRAPMRWRPRQPSIPQRRT